MSDLGQLLRKARTERNLSLDQVQETTKIRKRYLEAIEEGKYSILPGTFYVRAFIKQYSEAVGLDPDEVFRLYAHEIPSADVEPSAEPVRMKRRRSVHTPERAGKWASALLMIAFPLLIAGVIYYYFYHNMGARGDVLPEDPITDSYASEQGGGTEGPAGAPSPEPTPTPTPTPTPPPDPDVEFAEKFTYSSHTVERFTVKHADSIKLEVKVSGPEAWIGVTHADSKSKYLYQKGLTNGDSYAGEFAHPIYLNIGRANAVQLTVNGVVVEMGSEPNPRKFQFELVGDGNAADAGASAE